MLSSAELDVDTDISPESSQSRLAGTVWDHSELARGFYKSAEQVGGALGRAQISANMLTYSSLVFAAAAAVSVATSHLLAGAALVLASGACDLLDGLVARATNSATRFGALLDSTVDRLADALPLVGMIYLYSGKAWGTLLPALAMLTGFCISYIRARAEGLGARLPPLFMRRPERVIFLVASLLLGTIDLGTALIAPLMLAGVLVLTLLNVAACVAGFKAAHDALHDGSSLIDSMGIEASGGTEALKVGALGVDPMAVGIEPPAAPVSSPNAQASAQ